MLNSSLESNASVRNFSNRASNLATEFGRLEWEPRTEDWSNLYLGKKVLDSNEQFCGTAVDILTFSDSPNPEKILVQSKTFLGFDRAMVVPVHHICKITSSTVFLNITKKNIRSQGSLAAIRSHEDNWDSEDAIQLPFVL